MIVQIDNGPDGGLSGQTFVQMGNCPRAILEFTLIFWGPRYILYFLEYQPYYWGKALFGSLRTFFGLEEPNSKLVENNPILSFIDLLLTFR